MSFSTRLLAVLGVVLMLCSSAGYANAKPSHTQINGTGSSWAANAVNQWIADVSSKGLPVVFTSTGSAQGRHDFAYKTTDFGVSDIAYQGTDPVTHQQDNSNGRKYVYLPIAAGGTSFPYNLSFAGHRIRNLRLSGRTLALIFTNQIHYWDDAKIKADNNNKVLLPHIPIIPVVHSEGSGSTYQFTAYLAKQFGSIWAPYAGYAGATEYFPRKGTQQAQNGSDGVMNFITSSAGSGSIGFDEYSYAKLANFPVAKVRNTAGYYTAPTQYNVAVALTRAVIQDKHPDAVDYLTQDLRGVYVNTDPRTYPLSSYSYAIIPTGKNGVETKTASTAQRQTLADFLYYSICQGQGEIGPIGYSPLPINLVQDGFGQLARLKQADPAVDLSNRNVSTCNNPTFIAGRPKENHLAQIAPAPPACDKQGAGPCADGIGLANGNPVGNKAPSNNGGGNAGTGSNGTGGAHGTGSGTGSGTGTGTGTGTGSAGSATGSSTAPHIDPNTGQLVDGSGTSSDGSGTGNVIGTPSELASSQSSQAFNGILYALAVLLLLVVLIAPVALSRYLANRRSS